MTEIFNHYEEIENDVKADCEKLVYLELLICIMLAKFIRGCRNE